jgi:anhydro-N-acetylmuramic acid kinase
VATKNKFVANKNIQHLYNISNKNERVILGLMSGTSLDGLDLALCKISGSSTNTVFELLHFETVAYNNDFKQELQSIFCKEQVSLEKVCLMNNYVAQIHSKIINVTLQKWNVQNREVDVIASHGQTIYHSPKNKHQQQKFGNATLQIGDGDTIAYNTQIITVSDFRQKHIVAGGSGAPLAIYGDYFLFSKQNENRILLNIGGIANFTYLPSSKNFNDVFCTDVGPGNTLMDNYIQQNFEGQYFDKDGVIAQQGNVSDELLAELLQQHFFSLAYPKSTGQELFNMDFINQALQSSYQTIINKYDVVATLNMFTAKCIANAIYQTITEKDFTIYTSGGGLHNKTLMQNLQQLLPNNVIQSTENLGINPNAKEAILFAILANETLCGNHNFYNSTSGVHPKVTMGKVSFAT